MGREGGSVQHHSRKYLRPWLHQQGFPLPVPMRAVFVTNERDHCLLNAKDPHQTLGIHVVISTADQVQFDSYSRQAIIMLVYCNSGCLAKYLESKLKDTISDADSKGGKYMKMTHSLGGCSSRSWDND